MSFSDRIREDIQSVMDRDPAARTRLEIVLCYPGLWAVWFHRVSHRLWRAQLRLAARMLSQIARLFTGVDIHPAASLGRRLFIDHATGVVICDNVFIGNNANILGNVTVGENSRVGAGSVVLADVPPNSTVVGVPAHIVYHNGQRVLITDPHDIKDPLSDALIALSARVEELEDRFGAHVHGAKPFADEEAERIAYRAQLDQLRAYVSMGEGI
jgi:serine O-acetyltransferase